MNGMPASKPGRPVAKTFDEELLFWPAGAILAMLVGVIAYALTMQTPGAPYLVAVTAWMCLIIAACFWSLRRKQRAATRAFQWMHSIGTSLALMFISPQFIGIAVLVTVDGLLDELLYPNATLRSLRIAGVIYFGLLICIVGIAVLAQVDIFFLPQRISSIEISVFNVLLIVPYVIDILQRLWHFQFQIGNTVATLQRSNNSLATAQQELQQRLQERNQLLEISRAVGSTLDLSSLLHHMLTQLRTIIDFGRATVNMLRDEAMIEIINIGELPDFPSTIAGHVRSDDHAAYLLNLTQPLIIDEASLSLPGLKGSFMAVPFIVRGRAIGVMTLRHAQSGFYTQHAADLSMAFANQVAGMIDSAQLQEAAAGAMVVAERHRLARELHDSVSQSLFGIVLGTRTALEQIERAPDAARAAIDYSISLADTALAEMRALIFTLRPENLERKGLLAALQSQIDLLQPHHGMRISLEAPQGEPSAPLHVKEALYRISSEAIQNAIRHAACDSLTIRLFQQPGTLFVEVADDGHGFDPSKDYGDHLGLKTMRERAATLGGAFDIDSAPGRGTRISVALNHIA